MSLYFCGRTNGFFSTAIHGEGIPSDAVEISAADYANLLAAQSAGKCIQRGDDGYPEAVDPQPSSVNVVAARKRAAIQSEARSRRDALIPEYPLHERETWAQQAEEALAYQADSTAETPLLTAIAAARGTDVPTLAGKILAKRSDFATAGGAIIGAQQALEDQLEAALAQFETDGDETAARTAIAAIDETDPANWP